MSKGIYIIAFFLLITTIQSCKLINPPELIPSYLYITDITVNANASTEGSSSDNIVDAWVYIDGNLIGTYELPAKIPVIAEGNYTLQVYGGIKNSGFSAQRKIYPFYNPYETTLTYKANETDTITPVLTYKSSANIWIEDFEDPGIKLNSPTNSDTTLQITSNPADVFEGSKSGFVIFDTDDNFFECSTNEPDFNNFPKFGSPVYVELNYRTNNVLTTGLYHADNTLTSLVKSEYLNLVSTNNEWKKIYIDFTEMVSTRTSSTKHQIYFEIRRQTGVTTPLVFIDNVKILY